MDITEILVLLRGLDDCVVLPPAGEPNVLTPLALPSDVLNFYKLCGGVTLWEDSPYGLVIVPPNEFVPANPVIVGTPCPDDITSTWYILARDRNRNHITIDCAEARMGRCYDSSFDRHGIIGSCPIIAFSFEDFLRQVLASKGEYWYWLQSGFVPLGDAYDE